MTPIACPTAPSGHRTETIDTAGSVNSLAARKRQSSDEAMVQFRLRSAAVESVEAARTTRLAVARAKDGDREAIRYLYVRYANNIYSYVASLLRNHHEAEDVTQQVFAKLPDSLQRYEDRGAPFLSWLVRLARNAAIDQMRSQRAVPVAEPVLTEASDDGATRDRREILRAALAGLPEDQREIIVLRHVGGLAPAEIAARLGRSESAVNGLHHRGRRALRAELTRLGVAPVTVAA
ncbi:MAG TPA: sigma-70 family RNA polymerase sigma factor [Solirubrobacteraceae bacterium]|nr:sigma-70 family RNA polymerase sigma factor [Solirubrobacteraceae bacterium]